MRTKDTLTFSVEPLLEYMREHGIKARDLMKITDIAVATAYKINRGEPVRDLDVLYKIFLGLRDAGYDVTWFQVTGIE